ncbi:MAG: hypothetical protein KBT03_13015 [Bacteroidales bacterium]|nr:hypothetical protein [Candidatus Scybalousia scybalohippi]
MARQRSEKQIKNDIKRAYLNKVQTNKKGAPETFDTFYKFVTNISKATGESLKTAAKRRLNSNTYTGVEERMHKNLVDLVKEEGMYGRLYRMGGKTHFNKSGFTKQNLKTKYGGVYYHANGYYTLGGVRTIIWTADEGSLTQYVQFITTAADAIISDYSKVGYWQARKGEAINA